MSVQLVGSSETRCKDVDLVYKVAAKLGKNNNKVFSPLSPILLLERSELCGLNSLDKETLLLLNHSLGPRR